MWILLLVLLKTPEAKVVTYDVVEFNVYVSSKGVIEEQYLFYTYGRDGREILRCWMPPYHVYVQQGRVVTSTAEIRWRSERFSFTTFDRAEFVHAPNLFAKYGARR